MPRAVQGDPRKNGVGGNSTYMSISSCCEEGWIELGDRPEVGDRFEVFKHWHVIRIGFSLFGSSLVRQVNFSTIVPM